MLVLLLLSGFFGVIVSLTANYFVLTVRWFAELRLISNTTIEFNGLSFAPVLWLFLAVFILHLVRKTFDISRWHGPADAVYASHRTDNELDLKRGVGSTFAALVSLCGGAPVGQYGPLVNFGATIASFCSQFVNNRLITPEILMGCGVAAAPRLLQKFSESGRVVGELIRIQIFWFFWANENRASQLFI